MIPADRDSFIGRSGELDELAGLLAGPAQLVTITGPGGVGKTRVAMRLVARLCQEQVFPDGVVSADLRAVDKPDWVVEHIVAAAGLQTVSPDADGMTTLVERLRDARLLLVLDNCEQVAAEVGDVVGALLDSCPGLRVVATSRITLEIPGERQFVLQPLAAPHPDHPPGYADGEVPDAVALFADRAAAVDPAFDLDTQRYAVARICHRLGGFPLLVEIATSKLRMFSVSQLEQRLDEAFGERWSTVTRAGYRTTFRAVMDLSWDLCSPGERMAWQRLSVFAGGIPLDAAEATIDEGEDVELLLDGLIRQSLLLRDTGSERPRFVMPEPIRQYGLVQSAATGDQKGLRERHSAWYEAYLALAAAEWGGQQEVAWMDAVHAELDNIRLAVDWCVTNGNPGRGIRVIRDLFRLRVPFRSGVIREWRNRLEWVLERYPEDDLLRVQGLAATAWVASCQGDEAAISLLERARSAPGAAADPLVAWYLAAAEMLAIGDPGSVERCAMAREALRDNGGTAGDVVMATMFWGISGALLGDRATAERVSAACLEEAVRVGAGWNLTWVQWVRAMYHHQTGDTGDARALLRRSLPAQREIGDFWGPIWWVAVAAWLAAADGEYVRAAQLCGATDRVMALTGIRVANMRGIDDNHLRAIEQARSALGDAGYRAAYERGFAVSGYAAAITLALEEQQRPAARCRRVPGPHGLTAREYEIALLLAEHTNDEIAANLYISVATVKTHVGSVLHKLGVTSRRHVARVLAAAS